MLYSSMIRSVVARILKLGAVLLLLCFTVMTNAQGVLSRAQTGTIQAERQDDGYITISGRNYGFDNAISLVFLNGEEVGDEILDEGLVVRYTVNSEGILTRIEVLGPISKIESLEDS
ncbi:MAG: hypothetical protein COA96_17405 [SAR86 cluster bacterium]|uniref:DUF5666 domain-containing protein n=1 Tax=SAR86 cluster bacterium TaxID=2030880 RepID=A0A2A5AEV0_9GAMM|nr:MAG: hypothetical protein COA96_17405 [SAR86 cluster bacterium]